MQSRRIKAGDTWIMFILDDLIRDLLRYHRFSLNTGGVVSNEAYRHYPLAY